AIRAKACGSSSGGTSCWGRRSAPARSSSCPRRGWRKSGGGAGAGRSPPGSGLSRAHIYGYGRSLRPPQGTTIAPRRRAPFRQTLLADVHEERAPLALGAIVRRPSESGTPDLLPDSIVLRKRARVGDGFAPGARLLGCG